MAQLDLQLNITQGSGLIDPKYPTLHPSNIATVFGSPGASLVATCEGADIAEAELRKSYSFELDANGIGRFHLVQSLPGSPSGCAVSVAVHNEPNTSITKSASFNSYKSGERHFKFYNYTSGAPNDNKTPCCIYIGVDQGTDIGPLTTAVARASGNSNIANGQRSTGYSTLDIDKYGCVEIKITSQYSGADTITVALPESPDGEFLQLKLNFLKFPIWSGSG